MHIFLEKELSVSKTFFFFLLHVYRSVLGSDVVWQKRCFAHTEVCEWTWAWACSPSFFFFFFLTFQFFFEDAHVLLVKSNVHIGINVADMAVSTHDRGRSSYCVWDTVTSRFKERPKSAVDGKQLIGAVLTITTCCRSEAEKKKGWRLQLQIWNVLSVSGWPFFNWTFFKTRAYCSLSPCKCGQEGFDPPLSLSLCTLFSFLLALSWKKGY